MAGVSSTHPALDLTLQCLSKRACCFSRPSSSSDNNNNSHPFSLLPSPPRLPISVRPGVSSHGICQPAGTMRKSPGAMPSSCLLRALRNRASPPVASLFFCSIYHHERERKVCVCVCVCVVCVLCCVCFRQGTKRVHVSSFLTFTCTHTHKKKDGRNIRASSCRG